MAVLSPADGETLLRSLRLSAKYEGFYPAARAAELCVEHEELLNPNSIPLYSILSEEYGITPSNLRKAISTLCQKIWNDEESRAALSRMNRGVEITQRPTPDSLITILSSHLYRLRAQRQD